MYTDTECVASVQVAADKQSVDIAELTSTEYDQTDVSPSLSTLLTRFDDWDTVRKRAAEEPYHIPADNAVSDQDRCIAALKRARDVSEAPVTGAQYQYELDLPVSYHDILAEFTTWTQAKKTALE